MRVEGDGGKGIGARRGGSEFLDSKERARVGSWTIAGISSLEPAHRESQVRASWGLWKRKGKLRSKGGIGNRNGDFQGVHLRVFSSVCQVGAELSGILESVGCRFFGTGRK
jgi:hypothetical protein